LLHIKKRVTFQKGVEFFLIFTPLFIKEKWQKKEVDSKHSIWNDKRMDPRIRGDDRRRKAQ
jgi:hypothetical protein